MQPMSFSDFHPPAGRVIQWKISSATNAAFAQAPADPIPSSYNQIVHLMTSYAAACAGEPKTSWIATAFEIPGAVDVDALERCFHEWIARHDTLRSGFRPANGDFTRHTLDEVKLEATTPVELGSTTEVHAYLQEIFNAGTDPFTFAPYVLGCVDHGSHATVFVAYDHSNVDAYSLALTTWELRTRYDAAVTGEELSLPEVGSFVEYCSHERELGERISADDNVVGYWRDFVRDCGGTGPRFAVDLGVAPGEVAPHTARDVQLLDADTVAALEAVCRAHNGSGVFPAVLSALTIAAYEMTGVSTSQSITPLHTRSRPEWLNSIGWFVTFGPLEVSCAGASDFLEVLDRAHATFRGALSATNYPVPRVIDLLGDDFRPTRQDLFTMVSYMDYRSLPGADRYREWNSVSFGNVSSGDETQLWASRLVDGLYLSIRHPHITGSVEKIDEYVDRTMRILQAIASGADYPVPTSVEIPAPALV